jgi:hypothetical protein
LRISEAGVASPGSEPPRIFDLAAVLLQSSFAGGYVVPLVYSGMLRRSVEVTHASSQRRAFIDRTAACQREARIGDSNADGGDPYSGLRALREERLVPQRSGERVAPMACGLDLVKCSRRPQFGCDTAEFELERLRLVHRDGGAELLPAGIGKVDKVVQGTLGEPHVDGAVQ